MSRLQITSLVAVALLAGGSGVFAQDAGQVQMSSVMQAPLEKSRQAIIECREKRLKGELSTYAESARCSNPAIFEAWKMANYPHMDLITEWLNAREAASVKVDQRLITPAEFEREMEELTMRLTAEERKRRSGLLFAADSGLQPSLPPPAQPVSAVTPAAAQKPMAKRNTAARASPASQYVDLSHDSGVGSMGSLSRIDSPQRPDRLGAPSMRVAPNTPAPRVTATHTEGSEGGNNLYALLSSQQKEIDARAIYRMLQEKYPEILGGHNAVIRRADVSGKGASYRVEVGPLSAVQADQLCGSLRQAGAQCTQHYE